jgi:hypothetical protein
MAAEAWPDQKGTRSFSGEPGVKTYPASPGGKGEVKKMSNRMKVFQKGRWEYLEVQGEDLAERAKKIQKETPSIDFGEALILAEKQMMSESEVQDVAVKAFSEGGGAGGVGLSDRPAREYSERNPGLTRSDLEKLAWARRGVAVELSDGTAVMRVFHNGAEKFLPVSFRDAGDTVDFMDPKNFEGRDPSRGRFLPPKKPAERKPGFSEDGKSFTDFRTGRVTPVLTDSEEETEVEVLAFTRKFDLEFASVLPRDREAVAKRALQVLRAGGIEPFGAGSRHVALAVQAGVAPPENFDAALRYTSSREFLSFEKAVTAALA